MLEEHSEILRRFYNKRNEYKLGVIEYPTKILLREYVKQWYDIDDIDFDIIIGDENWTWWKIIDDWVSDYRLNYKLSEKLRIDKRNKILILKYTYCEYLKKF